MQICEMGKRDRIKQVFQGFSSRASTSKPGSTTSATALESRLNEPVDNGPSGPDNQSQHASVRDLWGLAIGKLSEESKFAISSIKSDSKLDILQHLRAAATEKQKDCEDKRWKYELNGRQIILRDVAGKIIVWIDKFKEIGDIAVNFDPVHASFPRAGIRFLLQV